MLAVINSTWCCKGRPVIPQIRYAQQRQVCGLQLCLVILVFTRVQHTAPTMDSLVLVVVEVLAFVMRADLMHTEIGSGYYDAI